MGRPARRREITLYSVDRPARRETGDDAVFLELEIQESKVKALVDTGASDCFMSKEMREKLPSETVVDTWRLDKGKIHLADNSNLAILEQVPIKFKSSGTTVCYDFEVVNNLCQSMVISRNFLTAVKADLSFPGSNCEIFGGNPISVVHEIDVPPNSEMILPVRPRQSTVRDKYGTYCEPASTAQVMVEACVNLPGQTWWLKVMNPHEQAIRISPGDVLAYTAEAAVPRVDTGQVPEFLDINYLESSDVPVALGRVAAEEVEEMVESIVPEGSETLKNEQQSEGKIAVSLRKKRPSSEKC